MRHVKQHVIFYMDAPCKRSFYMLLKETVQGGRRGVDAAVAACGGRGCVWATYAHTLAVVGGGRRWRLCVPTTLPSLRGAVASSNVAAAVAACGGRVYVWARWAHPRAAPAAVGGGGGSACPRLPARPHPRLYLPNATHDATLRCATLRYAAARRRLLVVARCCCSALAPAAAAPVELAGKLRLLPRLALPLPLASPIPLLRLLAAATRAARCCAACPHPFKI